jgi:hemolysin III
MAYQISFPYPGAWKAVNKPAQMPDLVCPVSGESRWEEVVNCLTHGLGLFLSIGGLIFLVTLAITYGNQWHVIGCTVYSITLVLVYAASTLYHGSGSLTRKRVLRQMDQAFVYLLIAGTYTPFTLVPLRGEWGWALFATVWGIALAAIGIKLVCGHRFSGASVLLYLGLGWLGVIAIIPLLNSLPWSGVMWLAAGGVAYTLGTVFLVRKPLPFSHGLWHMAVLIGSACHYLAVVFYVIPMS